MRKSTFLEGMIPKDVCENNKYRPFQTPCNCNSTWDDRHKELRQLEKDGEEHRDLSHFTSPKKKSALDQALREYFAALNHLAACRQDYDRVSHKDWFPEDTQLNFAER